MLRHVPYTGIRVLTFEQLRGVAQQRLGAEPGGPLPLPVGLAIGLTAGGLGQLVAVPADLVKVRMQVSCAWAGEGGWGHTACVCTLIRLLGAGWAGWTPRLPHDGVSSGGHRLPLTLYRLTANLWRRDCRRRRGELLGRTGCQLNPESCTAEPTAALTAARAPRLALVVASSVGLKPRLPARRYRGVLHALCVITAQHGVAGLWRGSAPAVQRAALVNLGELSTYDAAKRAVLRSGVTGGDNAAAHALSSVCSGFCASGERRARAAGPGKGHVLGKARRRANGHTRAASTAALRLLRLGLCCIHLTASATASPLSDGRPPGEP